MLELQKNAWITNKMLELQKGTLFKYTHNEYD